MPNPIALEDEIQLSESPFAASNTTNGATAPEASYFLTANFQGLVDNVHRGKKRGKIIMWSSTNDHVWMEKVISIYRMTGVALGHNGKVDYSDLQSWFRYYHAPGVGHCGGDIGASPTLAIAPDGNMQMFDDLVNWVEHGTIPQSAGDSTKSGILAIGPGTFGSRPLCPYPKTAIYNGSGSTAVASNYHCGGNLDTRETLCRLPITPFGKDNKNELNYKEIGLDPGFCEGNHDHDADNHDHDNHGKDDNHRQG